MFRFIVGGIVLASIGIVFIIEPWQFFVMNETMTKIVSSKPSYKRIFKFIGYLLIIVGALFICYGLYRGTK